MGRRSACNSTQFHQNLSFLNVQSLNHGESKIIKAVKTDVLNQFAQVRRLI